jgi:hypothetical protein
MGIRFSCPNGHKLNVKEFLAGKRGVCPQCGAKFIIPTPGDSQAYEATQSGLTGQSHSVDIISPTLSQSSVTAASSVIISLADSDVSQSPAVPEPVRVDSLNSAPAAISSLRAGVAPQAVALTEPTADSAETGIVVRRASSRGLQVAVSIVLFVLVIVLGIVLFLVMSRDFNPAPKQQASTSDRNDLSVSGRQLMG